MSASLAAGLGTALHAAGLPVGPDRCERLARAVTVMGARSLTELRACALATMVSDPGQVSTFDRVFAALFGTPSPFADPPPPADSAFRGDRDGGPQPVTRNQADPDGSPSGMHMAEAGPAAADGDEPLAEAPAMRRVASAAERLRGRDFTQLSDAELQELVALMRELSLSVPPGVPAGTGRPGTESGLTCAAPCARRGVPAARLSGSRAGPRGPSRAV